MLLMLVFAGCDYSPKEIVRSSTVDGRIVNISEKEVLTIQEKEIDFLYHVSKNWSIVPMKNGVNEKVVLLTIDDAPSAYSLEMAKTLRSLNAEAIFFVNGHYLDTPEEKETLKKIYDMGFEIGNHTFNHQLLSDLSESEQRDEIVSLNDTVEEIIGVRPKFFRAPNGVNTDYSRKVVKEEGLTLMNWSFGYDWEEKYNTKESLVTIILNTDLLTNGANILMHDREWTNQALPEIIKGLRQQGFEIIDPKHIKTD
ncbi:polysaccharide deacetylase family protein [Oceanobacillus halophilus]|uniref:Polysaccharide deacetylase family protein n=2 Tax=Oceanobacillus halophilus TaxID=930130 RepID=A0A495AE65_9BACI|nr:polysaccharide deacetylase family protein [Oceanobacillus halophilus]